jgi:hypothetical protein
MDNVWTSLVTSEMVNKLDEREIARLTQDLNDAVMEICKIYEIEGN